ncbi:unnamed protein product [Chrysoparadoxa australica]
MGRSEQPVCACQRMSFKGLIGMACLALLGPVKGFVAPTLPTGTAARAVARGRGTVRMVAMEPRQVRGESRQGRKPLLTASDLPGDWAGSLLESQDSLTYMPFMEWAANMLGTQLDMTRVEVAEKLSYAESVHPSRPGRIASVCFQSPEIRKARMTYFDAGPAVQVFNMVIYPDPSLDVPLLGVDLISFGDKNLAGIDFQPLYDGDEEYNSKYVQQMVPIKAKYPELGQKISQRYYESSKVCCAVPQHKSPSQLVRLISGSWFTHPPSSCSSCPNSSSQRPCFLPATRTQRSSPPSSSTLSRTTSAPTSARSRAPAGSTHHLTSKLCWKDTRRMTSTTVSVTLLTACSTSTLVRTGLKASLRTFCLT